MRPIRSLLKTGLAVMAAAALLGGQASAADQPPVNKTAALFKEFDDRVQSYVKLHKAQDSALPALKSKASAAKIEAHRKALAKAIRTARRDTKAGDIFFAEVRPEFLKILRGELKGPGSGTARAAIKESKPEKVMLRVNRRYPEKAPLSTVPPTVLLNLPRLPQELEYRFVNHHLVLRDAKANLIVDFMALQEVPL